MSSLEIKPADVRSILKEKLAGADISESSILRLQTFKAKVWFFEVKVTLNSGKADMELLLKPVKRAKATHTMRTGQAHDMQEVIEFVTDCSLILAGISLEILTGVEGEGKKLDLKFDGADDLVLGALLEE